MRRRAFLRTFRFVASVSLAEALVDARRTGTVSDPSASPLQRLQVGGAQRHEPQAERDGAGREQLEAAQDVGDPEQEACPGIAPILRPLGIPLVHSQVISDGEGRLAGILAPQLEGLVAQLQRLKVFRLNLLRVDHVVRPFLCSCAGACAR